MHRKLNLSALGFLLVAALVLSTSNPKGAASDAVPQTTETSPPSARILTGPPTNYEIAVQAIEGGDFEATEHFALRGILEGELENIQLLQLSLSEPREDLLGWTEAVDNAQLTIELCLREDLVKQGFGFDEQELIATFTTFLGLISNEITDRADARIHEVFAQARRLYKHGKKRVGFWKLFRNDDERDFELAILELYSVRTIVEIASPLCKSDWQQMLDRLSSELSEAQLEFIRGEIARQFGIEIREVADV